MGLKDNDHIKMCDIGDKFYRIAKDGIVTVIIKEIEDYKTHYVYRDESGHSYFNHTMAKSCFKTKEEAEAEIQRRKNIAEKRKILKEYEKELNKKLNIVDHYIIK